VAGAYTTFPAWAEHAAGVNVPSDVGRQVVDPAKRAALCERVEDIIRGRLLTTDVPAEFASVEVGGLFTRRRLVVALPWLMLLCLCVCVCVCVCVVSLRVRVCACVCVEQCVRGTWHGMALCGVVWCGVVWCGVHTRTGARRLRVFDRPGRV